MLENLETLARESFTDKQRTKFASFLKIMSLTILLTVLEDC